MCAVLQRLLSLAVTSLNIREIWTIILGGIIKKKYIRCWHLLYFRATNYYYFLSLINLLIIFWSMPTTFFYNNVFKLLVLTSQLFKNLLNLEQYKTEEIRTFSHLRLWNQTMFLEFSLINDLNSFLIIRFVGNLFCGNQPIN